MKILSDNINSQLQNTFSLKIGNENLKAMFTGVF
jgi:hypothetical protein